MAHTRFLDLQRQIAAIKEKQSNGENPHGWKIRPISLGVANAALEQKIIADQNAAAQLVLQHILDAKIADAALAYDERAAAIQQAVKTHEASVERILAANPVRYQCVSSAEAMNVATVELAKLAIQAEVEADLAYDYKAQARALKKLAFQEKAAAADTVSTEDDSAAMKSDLEKMKQELKNELLESKKASKPRNRPPKAARQPNQKPENSRRQNPNGQNPVSQKNPPLRRGG